MNSSNSPGHSLLRQVVDCGSPLPLAAINSHVQKRQWAAAVQDACAPFYTARNIRILRGDRIFCDTSL